MSTYGVIVSRTGTSVTVEVGGEVLPPIQLARHLHGETAATPGDACLVSEVHGARMVIAVVGTAPAPAPPPPDPGSGPSTGPEVAPKPPPSPIRGVSPVSPTWTGTYRGGWRGDTSDLYQGDWTGRGVNTGAAFYGGGLRAWDRLLRIGLQMTRRAGAGVSGKANPTVALLAGDRRSSGAPTVLAVASGPALRAGESTAKNWPDGWPIPSGWLARVQSGEAGGFGLTSQGSRTPYLAINSAGGSMTALVMWEDEP